jgi:phosphoserine phosphatase
VTGLTIVSSDRNSRGRRQASARPSWFGAHPDGGLLLRDAWRLVRAHLRQGHTVVIAMSATHLQVHPFAGFLREGFDEVLALGE